MSEYVIPSKLGLADPYGPQAIPVNLPQRLRGSFPSPSQHPSISGAAGAAASLAGAIPYVGPLLSAVGIGAQLYTNYRNREMQESVNRSRERLVREQNAYNSPVSQMARYKAAGLNPLAFMDQITPGLQSEVAQPEAATYESPDFGAVGDQINNSLDYLLQSAQTKSLVALRATQESLNVAREGTEVQKKEQTAAMFGLRLEQLDRENQLLSERINLTSAQISTEVSHANNLDELSRLYNQQRQNLLQEYGFGSERLRLITEQANTQRFMQSYYAANAQLLAAEAGCKNQELAMMTAYAGYYLNVGLDIQKIQDAYQLLSLPEKQSLLKNAALYSNIQSQYYDQMAAAEASGMKWSAEKTRAEAGSAYDYWQNNVWWTSTGVVTSGVRDVGVGIASMASAATGANALFSAMQPRPKIGFK